MSRWDWQEEAHSFGAQPRSFLDAVVTDERPEEEYDLDLVHAVHQRLITEIDPKKLGQLPPGQAYEAVISAGKRTLADVAPQVMGDARALRLDTGWGGERGHMP